MEIGIDIEKVTRINKLIKNKRFLNRLFTEDEIKYCLVKKNAAQHFAVRYAAKEAVWKALSSVEKKSLTHKDIKIKNTSDGKPMVILPQALKNIQERVGISLSHSEDIAVAVAVFV
ncbi:MAG: holo-ACP synthase [Elusimicrobiota bacterium]